MQNSYFRNLINIIHAFISATDQGTPTRTSTCQVNITVKNTNDNAPTFVPGSPIVYVSEAVAIGTKVVKFNATDEDGNKHSFSISEGNTNSDFAVDKDTGLLTTKRKLDRETIPRYNLTVTVTESTNTRATGQSSSQNLSVIVTDENDNGPVFNPKEYTEDIDENTPAGRLICRLEGRLTRGLNYIVIFSSFKKKPLGRRFDWLMLISFSDIFAKVGKYVVGSSTCW
jgi:hypothetical protein